MTKISKQVFKLAQSMGDSEGYVYIRPSHTASQIETMRVEGLIDANDEATDYAHDIANGRLPNVEVVDGEGVNLAEALQDIVDRD